MKLPFSVASILNPRFQNVAAALATAASAFKRTNKTPQAAAAAAAAAASSSLKNAGNAAGASEAATPSKPKRRRKWRCVLSLLLLLNVHEQGLTPKELFLPMHRPVFLLLPLVLRLPAKKLPNLKKSGRLVIGLSKMVAAKITNPVAGAQAS